MNHISDLGLQAEIKTRSERCDTHGDYVSRNLFRKVWSGCPGCAAEQEAVRKREEAEREAVARFYAWQRKLGQSGIPDRFQDRTLSSYVATTEGQRKALAFAKEYAEKFDEVSNTGRSAIFCGKPGTGKTHLAVGIGLSVMERNRMVLFFTVQRMVRRVKDAWRRDSEESESDVIDLLTQPDLLILDEIGVQFGTEFERNLMFDVLNERYENRRPTLLLSNLTPSEVKVFLGERVYDRLREDGGQCVPFTWDSHRGGA